MPHNKETKLVCISDSSLVHDSILYNVSTYKRAPIVTKSATSYSQLQTKTNTLLCQAEVFTGKLNG